MKVCRKFQYIVKNESDYNIVIFISTSIFLLWLGEITHTLTILSTVTTFLTILTILDNHQSLQNFEGLCLIVLDF